MGKRDITELMKLRLATGKTQEDIATMLNVSVQTIRNWESGRQEPHLTLDEWFNYAEYLETDINKLRSTIAEIRHRHISK